MSGRFVRSAAPEDAGGIAEIYNQGIADRIATFETEPRTASRDRGVVRERLSGLRRRAKTIGSWPMRWLFPIARGACYEGVREFSIYTAREARGKGFGRAALAALIEDAKARGWWKFCRGFFLENTASLALLQSAGFREVGIVREARQARRRNGATW